MNKRITITVGTKDRPTELFGLALSLRNNTYKDWDLIIVDDASGTSIENYYFLNVIFNRLRLEGHQVRLVRNNISSGIAPMRNQSARLALEFFPKNGLIMRIDDDTVAEPDFLQKLVDVIDDGYDLASGITPPMSGPDWVRQTKHIEPIVNRVVLDELGVFLLNSDDCGMQYDEEKILPCHHFRSTALYKTEVHTKYDVWYETNLTMSGMREEEFFSFRCILAGLKLGVHLGANHWHLQTPSGGHRGVQADRHLQNQKILNRWVKKKVSEHGNFIDAYNKKLSIDDEHNKWSNFNKSTNFIMTKEE